MKRLMLLIAAASLWLFLAAVPALADGGPHTASVNNGSTSLTADSCAGCHRAHTAQGAMLLKVPEEELCQSCHGNAVAGATTDVWSGIQYAIVGDGLRDTTAQIGALRSGGFASTRIGDPFRYTNATGTYAKVRVAPTAATSEPVTSAHIDMTGTLGQLGKAWGNGPSLNATGGQTGAGPTATVTCGSCHNVHGNDQYRILQRIPGSTGINTAWSVKVYDYGLATADTYRTLSSHGLLDGDIVTVSGMTGAGNATDAVVAVVSDTRFTLVGVGGGTGTNGLVTRSANAATGGVKVTDGPAVPAGDARNYTVIQTPLSDPTLLASEAAAFDPTDGDYLHYRIPWDAPGTALNTDYNYDAPNGVAGTVVTASGRQSLKTGERTFGQEITAWCTSCHTRYYAWSQPTDSTTDAATATGASYANARPDDDTFTYQHRTRGGSNRGCNTCHVSHGSSAVMDSDPATTGVQGFSGTFTYPDGTASDNSRLLKVDNRGTCQMCHEPTGTIEVGDQFPLGDAIPGTP